MIITVDETSPLPTFEQVRGQIAGHIASGDLPPGAPLPPVRQLAGDLGLAPGTVQRAYRALADAGLVAPRGRKGTFVSEAGTTATDAADESQLGMATRAFVLHARRLTGDRRAILEAVRAELGL